MGPRSSHYSWNRIGANTRASLLLDNVLTSNRKLNKGGVEQQDAATKKKFLGENSFAVVEVGIKNDAKLRAKVCSVLKNSGVKRKRRRCPDCFRGDLVRAALGLKAQVSVCYGTEQTAEKTRAGEVIILKRRCS